MTNPFRKTRKSSTQITHYRSINDAMGAEMACRGYSDAFPRIQKLAEGWVVRFFNRKGNQVGALHSPFYEDQTPS